MNVVSDGVLYAHASTMVLTAAVYALAVLALGSLWDVAGRVADLPGMVPSLRRLETIRIVPSDDRPPVFSPASCVACRAPPTSRPRPYPADLRA